ncbi:FKBP-type peptidyl-prolyl cis-trans isomerase [Glycocaulis sp.]|uniref:FKBP-type peptidyl-prolyl cis-trans isomerase n=1 Tax=Glycocaulis sp. TaxID=1969725 RepID=UPI003D21BD1C
MVSSCIFACLLLSSASFATLEPAASNDVVVLEGLRYEVLRSGPADGPHPRLSDQIVVRYEGRLESGEVFDSSLEAEQPVQFPLRRLIPGWGIALRLMRPGDDWIVTMPPEMAYGEDGIGPIPGNSTLVFRIQLIDIQPGEEGQ